MRLHQKRTLISRPITGLSSVKSLNVLNLNSFIMPKPFSTDIRIGTTKNINTDRSGECLRRNILRRELEINPDLQKLKKILNLSRQKNLQELGGDTLL